MAIPRVTKDLNAAGLSEDDFPEYKLRAIHNRIANLERMILAEKDHRQEDFRELLRRIDSQESIDSRESEINLPMEKKLAEFVQPPYIELQGRIQIWDCVHTWSKPDGFPEDVLDWFKNRIIPSLIEVFTDGGPHHTVTALKGLNFIEMTWPTIRYGHFTEYDWEHMVVEVGRHEYIHTVTPKQVNAAFNMISGDIYEQEGYEWEELPVHALQWFADKIGVEIPDISDPEGKVCSSYNAEIMTVLKNPWTWNGLNDPLPSPQDIRQADQYRLVGVWDTKRWVWED